MNDTPLRITFRADANSRLGLGHLRRCISLALALRRCGAEVQFVARHSDVDVRALVGAASLSVALLQADIGVDDDARATAGLAKASSADWVVVDHYSLDARWHEDVRARTDARVAVIDDLADRALAADLIVDQNFAPDHEAKYAAVNHRASPVLGGPDYAMLDPRFADAPRNPAADPVFSIGIFMGGADAPNLSERAWKGLREVAGFTGGIEIAATRANPHLRRLAALAAGDTATRLSVDAANLAAFFGRHELHIGAGGSATWERCCLGAPTLAVIAAENQRSVLLPLAQADVFMLVAQELPDAPAIGRATRALINSPAVRQRQSQRARALVDGHGCARIAQRISTLCLR